MDYKVMKRPMFKMGGPTSGGTGITSGLETPRQNFAYSTYGEAVQAIPAMFEKTMTGLENRRSAIGPMALLQAAASGAFSDVGSIGDLAMSIGSPEFLGAGMRGMESSQKLDSQIDALGLKEATTMATLLKPDKLRITDYDKKIKRIRTITILSRNLNEQNADLEASKEGKNDLEIAQIDAKIKSNNNELDILNKEEKIIISRTKSRQEVKDEFVSEYEANKGFPPSNSVIKDYMQSQGFFSEGGRIDKQMGGGFDMAQEQPMQAPQTMAPGPEMMQPQGQDPFQILRSRLPQEISDEVVSLIAYNKKAFADFANIQDQDDVDLFNQKYNVQLVVDLASR